MPSHVFVELKVNVQTGEWFLHEGMRGRSGKRKRRRAQGTAAEMQCGGKPLGFGKRLKERRNLSDAIAVP